MYTIFSVIHIIVCFFLIGVVLLQQGKGADMGAVFGGSSQTLFGSGGAGNFLTRLTTAAAVIFLITSLALDYGSARRVQNTIFDEAPISGSAPGVEAPVPGAEPAAQVNAPQAGEAPAPAAAPAPAEKAAPAAGEPAAPAPPKEAAPAAPAPQQ